MLGSGADSGFDIVGVETKRGNLTGWYELQDNMELRFWERLQRAILPDCAQ